jgi:Kef-type K+ transport system membrane component KefB
MDSKYLFLLQLGIVLISAHLAGLLSERFKQPAVLGQIIVGLILGAGFLEKTALISEFAEIGVILLMFIAGLETDVKELVKSSRSSSLIALGGVILPAVFVYFGMRLILPDHDANVALFLAVVSTATSVSISVQTLREIAQLRTRQGIMILGAAIIDDIIGIILLTLLVGVVRPGAAGSILLTVAKILAFFIVLYVVGRIVVYILRKLERANIAEDKLITWAIFICLVLSFASEEFGVAAITGAYFAGVIFSLTAHKHRVSHEVSKLSNFMFTPVFFVSIGMDIDLGAAFSALGIGSILIVLGVLGKVLGCGFGAYLTGFDRHHAIQIGVGMIPRAEVAIIVANLGLQMSILTDKEMAATIVMVLVTTLITPSLLKWSFSREVKPQEAHSA